MSFRLKHITFVSPSFQGVELSTYPCHVAILTSFNILIQISNLLTHLTLSPHLSPFSLPTHYSYLRHITMGRQEPLLSYNTTRPSRTRGSNRQVKGGLLSQLHNNSYNETPSTPKLTPRKALLATFLALLGLSLLHRPVSNRYNGVPRYGNGLRSPEERARHILTTTPLIGMTFSRLTATKCANMRYPQMAMSISQ